MSFPHPAPRDGLLRFLRSGNGVLRTQGAATLVEVFRVQSTVDNAAQRVTGMDVIAQTGAPANRETEHAAQRSTIMFHVKPGVDCAQRPVQRASATSAEDAPFSHSPVHRVPLREPGEDLKRSDAAGLPSVALTRAARLLQGDTGELASGGPDTNRLSSSARGNANGEVDAGTTRIHNATYHQVPIAFLGFT